MTDVEKAEEYYEDNECYSYLSEVEDFEEVFGFVKDRVKQAYLDGLAEGRKESKEYITWLKRQRQGGIQKQFNKANKIKSLEKENAELKEQLEEQYEDEKKDKEYLDKVNNKQTEIIIKLNEQIEKMKNCRNCEHEYDWEDNDYCVGCLSLFHDKKPKWEMRKW